jgi:hypothetical protein
VAIFYGLSSAGLASAINSNPSLIAARRTKLDKSLLGW